MRVFVPCFVAMVFAASFVTAATADLVGQIHVVDGDTIDVGDVRVRIHGIDAPEVQQTCQTEHGVSWSCGIWVTEQVSDLFSGQGARCETLTTDKYARIVARCAVQGRDMAHEIVRAGLAFAYRKYAQEYVAAENSAAAQDVGLHASHVQNPSQFRQTRAVGRMPPNRKCKIKGNISNRGVHIFHLPGQRDYERTGIRPEKGERWFCSEAEARGAGWRVAKR